MADPYVRPFVYKASFFQHKLRTCSRGLALWATGGRQCNLCRRAVLHSDRHCRVRIVQVRRPSRQCSVGVQYARACFARLKTRACVKKLVTIGTPHLPPEEGSDGSFDQTRGILTYVQRNYLQLPAGIDGASVGSKFLKGEADAGDLGAFVTGIGYQQVCGKAQVWGDGIVPVPSMRVPGWQWREVSGVWHSPLGALDRKWYGDDGVISEWVDLLE